MVKPQLQFQREPSFGVVKSFVTALKSCLIGKQDTYGSVIESQWHYLAIASQKCRFVMVFPCLEADLTLCSK